ncbi:MAG: LysR family transcriptional regulator [Rhodospirillaceae bacterium]
MSLDTKSLELFVRVAALGAIGKAGAEVGLSRTAATQRIQALETELGIQLFHRTTRTLSLTSDGETFLGHARRILETFEEALSDAQKDPRAIRGELRIASSASFGRQHIAPHMAEFLDRYPGISIQLSLSDMVIDLVNGGFDLSIRLGDLAPSSLRARRLADSPRIIVAAPSYMARHDMPETPEDLSRHNCLMRGGIKAWKLKGPDGRVRDYKAVGNFDSDSAEAITEAAQSGLGIARKCRWEITEQLKAGSLVQILADHTILPEWSIFAVRSPSRHLSARVRAFTDFLKAKYEADLSFS